MRNGFRLLIGAVGVGLPPPTIALDSPSSGALLLAGVQYTLAATVEAGCTVNAYNGVTLLGAATVIGTSATYAWTPSSGDEGATSLTMVATRIIGGLTATSNVRAPYVLANAALRTRANDTASYTRSGSNLLSLVNQQTGVSASTLIGAPGWTADDNGSGLPGFTFNGASGVGGTEAQLLTALGGADHAFAAFVVARPAVAKANGVYFGSALSSHASQQVMHFAQSNSGAGLHYAYRINTTVRLWDSEPAANTRHIIEWRTTDSLTVFCRKNGGAESSETLAALGTVSPNRWAVGCQYASTPNVFFTGTIFEILYINAHKSSTIMTEIRTRLAADWSI